MLGERPHATVAGGGILGLACAHALLEHGFAVTIIDDARAGAPSLGNAGWIAHLNVMPLASGKVWRHLPRWLADPLGPLAIRPAYLPRLTPWLLRFAAASRPSRVRAAMPPITALNRLALPEWERMLARLGLGDRLRRRGFLRLWPSEGARQAELPVIAWQREHCLRVELLDPPSLRELEPMLAPRPAAFYPDGAHVFDPALMVAALREAAIGRGARFLRGTVAAVLPGTETVAVRIEDGTQIEADRVVIACGAWSAGLARSLGDRVPLDTERGYNVTFPPGRLGLSRPVDIDAEGFVMTPLDTGDRVGGAVEFAGLHAAPNFRRVDAILARLRRFLPEADLSGGTRWMGFRPSLPDSLPVIGPAAADPRVVYAFGHNHYGLTQSAVTGRLVADVLGGRAPPLDLAPFSARRFA